MWLAADTILENATDSYTKFFALQTLEQVILVDNHNSNQALIDCPLVQMENTT